MTNKKITDLVELTTPTTDDVFPLVDIATNGTRKAQLANLPISTATQTALDAKQATLVSGTNIKTINSTSLLGSGDISITNPPAGTAGQIQFSDGSAFAADSNLFWDNTNKRLGVGTSSPSTTVDILPPTQTATGTQFDCVRVGYSNSTINVINKAALQVQVATTGAGRYSTTLRLSGQSDTSQAYLKGFDSNNFGVMLNRAESNLGLFSDNGVKLGNTTFAGGEGSASAMLHIKGSGSTSATTALLVQNSSGTELFKVTDDSVTNARGNINVLHPTVATRSLKLGWGSIFATDAGSELTLGAVFAVPASPQILLAGNTRATGANTMQLQASSGVSVAESVTTPNSSAQLDVSSTTKGFLPPRMTTTQKNAIASPASGLMVYDTTTNKLCCYNGTTWNDLF